MKIAAFAGSLRKNSWNKKVLKVVVEGARNAGAEVTILDLNDYEMPIYNEDLHNEKGFDENALKFQQILSEHDGLIVASPEYNGSLPAALKNPLDWASRQSDSFKMGEVFKGKVAAITTASPGGFGGIRCLGHLRSILTILGVHVLPAEFAVGNVGKLFDGDTMTDEKTKTMLEEYGASLVAILRKTHGEIEVVTPESR